MSASSSARATQYYDSDFAFDELSAAEAEYSARVRDLFSSGEASDETRAARAAAAAAQAAFRWNRFYRRNGAGAYKPRHFIVEAFPCLRDARSVVDVGCGSGANVWPLLEKTRVARIAAVDVASAALEALAREPRGDAALRAGRVELYCWDFASDCAAPAAAARLGALRRASSPPAAGAMSSAVALGPASSPPASAISHCPPHGGGFDAALVTFTASAVHPRAHAALIARAAALLAPGGRLLFRDHGTRDLAQLRAADASILSASLNERGDGTLAYFFALQEVRALLAGAGLRVEEARHACVCNVNRKTGAAMRRVYVHAVARKPPLA
jgi:methyltransferase-like protein 6